MQVFQHVTLRLFPTLRHEILLETEKATVFQEIGHWLTDLTNKKTLDFAPRRLML